jgi:hypothetical protein
MTVDYDCRNTRKSHHSGGLRLQQHNEKSHDDGVLQLQKHIETSHNDGGLRQQEHMNKTNITKCVYVKISRTWRKGLQGHVKM